MYRTLCVLALLTLQAGLAHCFSWDVVIGTDYRLQFLKEEKVTYSVTFTDVDIFWILYDPYHNRVLFTNGSESLLSFDIATRTRQTICDFKPVPTSKIFNYDPATSLFFAMYNSELYSYLVKPGSDHEVDANFVTDLGDGGEIAVDSCGGYIYWTTYKNIIKRVRLNGSGKEEVIRSSNNKICINSVTIDPQSQNMYWLEYGVHCTQPSIHSADLNGKHRRTLYKDHQNKIYVLTVSNDFIYWVEFFNNRKDNKCFWKIPKNLPLGTNVEPKQIAFNVTTTDSGFKLIAANYAIREQTQGIPLCKALKRLLPNYPETNHSDSLNVSTGGSLLRDVNETKVSGESRVSGDTWNVPVCQYYCFQGNCSVSADGQPKCRCNAGYSGERCETNGCQAYCLHGGVCSLSEQNNPVCQCTGDYQGERCDVPAFLIKCSQQTVSLLKDADLTSVNEGKGVKSTCASTVD